jgi:hypothetical protein
MQTRCPKTFAYLKLFEKMLRERAAFKRYFRPDRDPFYSMFNISDYTFAPWKVVWPEVANSLEVAVAGPARKKTTVPDHTLIMIECESEDEANYLCATLNSSPSRHVVQAYIVLHPDPHVMGRLRIPKCDPKDKVHKRLAELSMQAHELAKTPASDKPQAASWRLEEVEAEIDVESAKLWNLSASDLAEIQRSLKELTE